MNSDEKFSIDLPFFVALSMFLSAVEFSIPKPLPFIKIGLANLPVIICLGKVKFSDYVKIVVAKIICGAIIGGTLFSYVFIFSLLASISSGLIMWFFYRINCRRSSLIGTSLIGSLANNLTLILCSKYIMFGNNVKYLSPLILISGFVSGILLGIFSELFVNKSKWYNQYFLNKLESFPQNLNLSTNGGKSIKISFKSILWILICSISLLVLVFYKNYIVSIVIVLIFLLINILLKNKINLASLIIVTVFICLFSCLSPYGKVIFSVWKIKVTDLSLITGIRRSCVLCGMLLISKSLLKNNMLTNVSYGKFLGKVFNYLSLLQNKGQNDKKDLILSVDERLLACFKEKTNVS